MPNFSRSRSQRTSFGKKSFGNKGGFDRGPKQMHKAECAKCGDVCEVPFRPNGERPVYCNNCFVKDDALRTSRGTFSSHDSRREFIPRPSFQRDRPSSRPDNSLADLKTELREVNERLERLIVLMTPASKIAKTSKKKE